MSFRGRRKVAKPWFLWDEINSVVFSFVMPRAHSDPGVVLQLSFFPDSLSEKTYTIAIGQLP